MSAAAPIAASDTQRLRVMPMLLSRDALCRDTTIRHDRPFGDGHF
jgi:hypothetical protein